MVYHATESLTQINGYRNARIEKIDWDEETGETVFPKEHGYYHPQPVPSELTSLTPSIYYSIEWFKALTREIRTEIHKFSNATQFIIMSLHSFLF